MPGSDDMAKEFENLPFQCCEEKKTLVSPDFLLPVELPTLAEFYFCFFLHEVLLVDGVESEISPV